VENLPLYAMFLRLFSISTQKEAKVAKLWENGARGGSFGGEHHLCGNVRKLILY